MQTSERLSSEGFGVYLPRLRPSHDGFPSDARSRITCRMPTRRVVETSTGAVSGSGEEIDGFDPTIRATLIHSALRAWDVNAAGKRSEKLMAFRASLEGDVCCGIAPTYDSPRHGNPKLGEGVFDRRRSSGELGRSKQPVIVGNRGPDCG